jgi:hypothetical protein
LENFGEFMKRHKEFLDVAVILAICGFAFTGYTAAAQTTSIEPPDPASNMAVVSIDREKQVVGAGISFNIVIDDAVAGEVRNGKEIRLEIPNGTHSIMIKPKVPTMFQSKKLNFTAASNVILFSVKTNLVGIIEITPIGSDATVVAAPKTKAGGSTEGIEGAINKVCETLISRLPPNSTIAVLSVSSPDKDVASFVVDEIEFQLVDAYMFDMVDRKTLDSIRFEQNFQMSGEVDDGSAVSIGNLIGANVVITGAITGSKKNQRLTVKALDVKTGKIVSMAREQF